MGMELWSVYTFSVHSYFSRTFPVGLNNHRQFLIFVVTLVVGVCLFDYLTYECTFRLVNSLDYVIEHAK